MAVGVAAAAGAFLYFYTRRAVGLAKATTGGTIAVLPATYQYLLQHIGESSSERLFRESMEEMDRAIMLGSPDEAYLLRFFCEALGAKKVIEVGVFRGTTTLQLAKAVGSSGVVYALDVDSKWLDAGGRNAWIEAGVDDRIRFVEGPAAQSMSHLQSEHRGTFDFVFIDADKTNYDIYYEHALLLLRVGGICAVDNVLWHGKAEHPVPGDAESVAINKLNSKIKGDSRVAAVMLGIADGVYLVRKL